MNQLKRLRYGVLCTLLAAMLVPPGLAFAEDPPAPADGSASSPDEDKNGQWVCAAINGTVLLSWWLAKEGDEERCSQGRHINYKFSWENDSWFTPLPDQDPPDENYTNGIFLESKYRLMDSSSDSGAGDPFAGYAFGNLMFTPVDTKATQVVADQRPYAGVLFYSLFREEFDVYKFFAWFPYERREITVSILGKYALSEWLQQGIHVFSDRDISRGWDNQIGTDVGLALHYSTYPFVWNLGNVFDMAPLVSLNAGSPFTDMSLGLKLRLGWLPPYYEQGPDSRGFALYAFGGVEQKYVVFNATLEGGGLLRNILAACAQCENRHTVDREEMADYITTSEVGAALKLGFWNNMAVELRLSWLRQTKEISAARFNDDGHDWLRFTVIAPFGGG